MTRKAEEAMAEILRIASEARKMSLSLRNVQYGDALQEQLMTTSSKMETIYGNLQDLVSRGVSEEDKYTKMLSIANAKMEWFTKAQALSLIIDLLINEDTGFSGFEFASDWER